jgi:hypothetical protein
MKSCEQRKPCARCDAWKDVRLKACQTVQLGDLLRPARVIYRLVETSEDLAAVFEKVLARGYEHDASRASLKELDPELILDLAKLATERRLGFVETHSSRFAETSFLNGRHEVAQVSKFQFPTVSSVLH